jgi:hypothetical protein
MNKKATPSAPDFTGDEHWGRGGQYVVVDGKRVPAPPVPDVPADAPATAAPAEQTPVTKGN